MAMMKMLMVLFFVQKFAPSPPPLLASTAATTAADGSIVTVGHMPSPMSRVTWMSAQARLLAGVDELLSPSDGSRVTVSVLFLLVMLCYRYQCCGHPLATAQSYTCWSPHTRA